jgi:hypothetical protein
MTILPVVDNIVIWTQKFLWGTRSRLRPKKGLANIHIDHEFRQDWKFFKYHVTFMFIFKKKLFYAQNLVILLDLTVITLYLIFFYKPILVLQDLLEHSPAQI